MRVLSLGKENLDIELSGTAYQICGDLGGCTGYCGSGYDRRCGADPVTYSIRSSCRDSG